MRFDLDHLPDDPMLLQRIVRDMAEAMESERTQLSEAQGEVERLRGIIKQLQRAQFGRRSERLDPDQLQLGIEELDADIARTEAHAPEQAGRGDATTTTPKPRALPAHLPREERVLAIDAETCPDCGGQLHSIGESMSEMLDWVPAQLRVIRIRRPKFACRKCGTVHQAPAPERVIAKGLATPELLSHVLVSKYCDHVPLYRQAQIFARHGVELERSTL